jgi:hypothetical protein
MFPIVETGETMIYYKRNKGNLLQEYLYAFFPKKHLKAARLDNETLQKIQKENKNQLIKFFTMTILFGLIPIVFILHHLITIFDNQIIVDFFLEINNIIYIILLLSFLYIFFSALIKAPKKLYKKLYKTLIKNSNIPLNNLYRLTQKSRNKNIREVASTAIFYKIAVDKENPKFIDDNNKLIEYVDNDVHEKLLKLGNEYLTERTPISTDNSCFCKTCLCLNSKECDKDTCICENCECMVDFNNTETPAECSCLECECEFIGDCLSCPTCLYCECLNQTLDNMVYWFPVEYKTVNHGKSLRLKEYLLAKETEKTEQYSTYISPHLNRNKKKNT